MSLVRAHHSEGAPARTTALAPPAGWAQIGRVQSHERDEERALAEAAAEADKEAQEEVAPSTLQQRLAQQDYYRGLADASERFAEALAALGFPFAAAFAGAVVAFTQAADGTFELDLAREVTLSAVGVQLRFLGAVRGRITADGLVALQGVQAEGGSQGAVERLLVEDDAVKGELQSAADPIVRPRGVWN